MASYSVSKTKNVEVTEVGWNIMATGFSDTLRIVVDFLPREETSTTEEYVKTLQKLEERIPQKEWDRRRKFFSNTTMPDQKQAVEHGRPILFGWATVPNPPYSPGLAPSDYHLFGVLCYKKGHWKPSIMATIKKWKLMSRIRFASNPPEIYQAGINAIIWSWSTAVKIGGDYVRSKDVKRKLFLMDDLLCGVLYFRCNKINCLLTHPCAFNCYCSNRKSVTSKKSICKWKYHHFKVVLMLLWTRCNKLTKAQASA